MAFHSRINALLGDGNLVKIAAV